MRRRRRGSWRPIIHIVHTSVSPLVLPAMLERARAALDLGEPMIGRAFVDDAIQRLAQAKAAQDAVLDEAARMSETPARRSTSLRADLDVRPRGEVRELLEAALRRLGDGH